MGPARRVNKALLKHAGKVKYLKIYNGIYTVQQIICPPKKGGQKILLIRQNTTKNSTLTHPPLGPY